MTYVFEHVLSYMPSITVCKAKMMKLEVFLEVSNRAQNPFLTRHPLSYSTKMSKKGLRTQILRLKTRKIDENGQCLTSVQPYCILCSYLCTGLEQYQMDF